MRCLHCGEPLKEVTEGIFIHDFEEIAFKLLNASGEIVEAYVDQPVLACHSLSVLERTDGTYDGSESTADGPIPVTDLEKKHKVIAINSFMHIYFRDEIGEGKPWTVLREDAAQRIILDGQPPEQEKVYDD